MKSFIKNNKLLATFFLVFIILIPVLVFAIDQADEGYRLDPGQTKTIYHKNGSGITSSISYKLENSGSVSYFIPTRSLYEWESVYWKFPNMDLSLTDYCGNGLCGMCENPVQFGTTDERVRYFPPSTNLKFSGYACRDENACNCPQDCGYNTACCGDGDCTKDYYEDYSNCTADCKMCSSLDYFGVSRFLVPINT